MATSYALDDAYQALISTLQAESKRPATAKRSRIVRPAKVQKAAEAFVSRLFRSHSAAESELRRRAEYVKVEAADGGTLDKTLKRLADVPAAQSFGIRGGGQIWRCELERLLPLDRAHALRARLEKRKTDLKTLTTALTELGRVVDEARRIDADGCYWLAAMYDARLSPQNDEPDFNWVFLDSRPDCLAEIRAAAESMMKWLADQPQAGAERHASAPPSAANPQHAAGGEEGLASTLAALLTAVELGAPDLAEEIKLAQNESRTVEQRLAALFKRHKRYRSMTQTALAELCICSRTAIGKAIKKNEFLQGCRNRNNLD